MKRVYTVREANAIYFEARKLYFVAMNRAITQAIAGGPTSHYIIDTWENGKLVRTDHVYGSDYVDDNGELR